MKASCPHISAHFLGRQVLCASNATHDQVDPVDPPEGAAVGERVTFQGFEGAPEPVLNPKKKVFEKLAPDLQTDDSAPPLPATGNIVHVRRVWQCVTLNVA